MRKIAILFCIALMMFAAGEVWADVDYVRLAIKGTNVNLRPQPLAEGRVTAQMNTGDLFIAEKAIIFNRNGNSKWRKIVFALDAATGNISTLSEWDSRFGANVAFVHADYATASPLAKGDMEKIKATLAGGSAGSASSGSITGYWARISFAESLDDLTSLSGYYFAEGGAGLLFAASDEFEIREYAYADGTLSFTQIIEENSEGYEPGKYTRNYRARLLSENHLEIDSTVYNRMFKIEQTAYWGGRLVTQLDGSVYELAHESGVFNASTVFIDNEAKPPVQRNENAALTDTKLDVKVSGPKMSGSDFQKLCVEGSLQEINEAIKNGADVNAKDSSGRTALMYVTGENENAEVTDALLKAGAGVNVKDSDGRTALIYAAWFNKDPDVIDVLVKAGADVKAKDDYGMTALLRAVQYNENPEVISVLLRSGADVNDKDEDGKRTIDYAKENISLKNTGVLKELEQAASRHAIASMSANEIINLCRTGTLRQIEEAIQAGMNVNASNDEGRTVLMYIAEKYSAAVLNALIKAGADVNAKMNGGWTALTIAAQLNENLEITSALIKAGADVNVKSDGGTTPLMTAVQFNQNLEIISALIKAGANVNAKNNGDWTPLMIATRYNEKPEATNVLIAAGANVNAKMDDGWTSLMLAVQFNQNLEITSALIKAGADVNAKNNSGWSPLMIAGRYNEKPEVTNALIAAGANVNEKMNDDWTPLMLAAGYSKNPEVINALLAAGANINAKNSKGFTPLILAVQNNENHEVMGALIKAGADVNAKDSEGTTELMIAAINNNTEAANALIKAGADVNAKDSSGITALMLAARLNKTPDIVSILLKNGADAKAKDNTGKSAIDRIWENENLKNTSVVRELEQAVARAGTTTPLRADPPQEGNVRYVRLHVMGVNVNVRDAAGTGGKVLFQANPGDGFIAEEELVTNADGSKWYKIVMTIGDGYVPLATDERFGVTAAYISANFVNAEKDRD